MSTNGLGFVTHASRMVQVEAAARAALQAGHCVLIDRMHLDEV